MGVEFSSPYPSMDEGKNMIQFASRGDNEHKPRHFIRVSESAYLLTAENDTNTGVVVTPNEVMVIDTKATPFMAEEINKYVRTVSDKPIKYVVLTHYHAARALGAPAHDPQQIIASKGSWELLKERGKQDFKSEIERLPRLFTRADTIKGMVWPTLVFERELTVWMDDLEVRICHVGKGHTKGDTVVWLPGEKVLFTGDLVEQGATPYCGDAYITEWPDTLKALRAFEPQKLVPGRGMPLTNPEDIERVIAAQEEFIVALRNNVAQGIASGHALKRIFDDTYADLKPKYGHLSIFEHCQSFNVSRCYDELTGIRDPVIWTAERDLEMWNALREQ
nr:cyclase [uncultured bacterium]